MKGLINSFSKNTIREVLMMKKTHVLVVSILFSIALTSAALAARLEKIEERSFPLTKQGSLSVKNVAGEILIHAWDEEKVKMVATKWARAASEERAQELLDAIEIEITSKEDQLDIATEFPWWKRLSPTSSVRVDYELWIPLAAKIRAQSVSGSIQVQERDNTVWVKTVSGAIGLGNIVGDVEAKTVSGEIKIEEAQGDMTLDTTSGRISLEGIEGIIEAHTVSGRVKILNSRGAARSIRTTSGDIWVELEEIKETASGMLLSSTSGDITLFLPKDAAVNIEAETTSGRISSEFRILIEGEIGKGKIRGTIGEGGIKIRLKTTSGDISLRSL